MPHIIALGGGGFSMEPDNPALDRYVLSVARARAARPRVCFLPSATDNSDSYLLKFYRAFGQLECLPAHLSLFHLPTADLEGFVLGQDLIYVGGGDPPGDTCLEVAVVAAVVFTGKMAKEVALG